MAALTYLALNAIFMLIACIALGRVRAGRSRRQLWTALVHILIMTAIFDSLIIMAGIVNYDESKISGITIWLAPAEDFAYAVAAVIFVPLVWTLLGPKQGGTGVDER